MKQALIVGLVAVVVGCSPSFAQVSGSGSSASGMGLTSPLTMLPGSPVPPTGNPMGATEMAMPGISPPPLTPGNMNCPSAGSSMPGGSSTSTGLFDGGGMGGASSTASCGGTSSATSSMSSAPSSPSTLSKSPSGGVGIPLGSDQLSDQGVSPMPVAPMTPLTPMLPPSTGGAVPGLTAPPAMNTSPAAPTTEGSILQQGIFPCPHSRFTKIPGGC
jgi:hypothetical protein